MPSSISASLEPGLERGVPWGRDLYTFVTSAAGHMMRTLQKPRKNRPSKRQVNHRRFLHNMIQRKFADIEAANHRLSSALYFKDGEKNLLPVSSHKSKSPDSSDDMCQSDSLPESDKCSRQTADVSKSRRDDLVDLQDVRENEKNQADLKDLSQYHEPSTFATKLNHQSEKTQSDDLSSYNPPKVTECYHTTELFLSDCCPKKSQPTLSANTQFSQKDSSSICCENQNDDISLSFSPELSPLSFSIQAFTEESGCTQVQKSAGETSLPDIADLFSVNKKDSSVFMEVEACFENVCDAELDVYAEDGFSLLDLADNFTTGEDLQSYSWNGGQGLSTNCIQNSQRSQSKCLHSKNTDLMQNQLDTSRYDVPPLEMYQSCQEESPSMLLSCENNTSFTSFEGVAQSFTAPPHPPFHRPIPTPPQEDDWMFTNILTDRKFFFF